jgi:hypothetical protein
MTHSTVPVGTTHRQHRAGVAVFAAIIAFSAYAGAIGLVSGGLSLGDELTARLPFGSPVLGGIALALIVAVPSTWLAWLAWQADPRTDAAALAVGIVIIGWIVVELAFIREFSFFHPVYLVVGAALIWIGRHGAGDLWALLHRPAAHAA